jgi:AcrR family transcriptional regulator
MRSAPPRLDSGELSPPPPRQKRSAERRVQLLAAARELFAEKGYEAAAIDEIAKRAHAAAGAFYLYFRSKRQLLVVLMSDFLERLAALQLTPQSGTDMRSGLREFLSAVFRTDIEYSGVVRAWREAAASDPEIARMQKDIETWTHGRVLRVFRELNRHSNARADADLPGFARMMDRHFWSLLARRATSSSREFQREVALSADVIFRYLFRDSGPER